MIRKNREAAGHHKPGKRWLKVFLSLVLAGVLLFGALLGAVLGGSHDRFRGEPEVMVVLGCMVYPWGPSILLADRLDKALDYLQEHPDMTVVVSGGQGPDEPTSEARAMHDYLVAGGFPSEQILLEDRSSNTIQNLKYSAQLLKEQGLDTDSDIIVVSNGFHLTRVRMLFERVWDGEGELSTLAAPSSHMPSRLKMYVREPLALMKSFLFDR